MRFGLLTAIAVTTLGAATAQASLLAYEGFDYETGGLDGKGLLVAPVSPAASGYGFAANSTYNAIPNAFGSLTNVEAGNLSYAGFPAPVGNRMIFTGGNNASGLGGSPATWTGGGRAFGPGSTASTPASLTDGTYYYSFLFGRNGTATNRGWFNAFGVNQPYNFEGNGVNNYQEGFGIRFFDGNFHANTPVTFGSSTIPMGSDVNAVFLVVGKVVIDLAGGSSNTIWVNPTDLTGIDPAGGASVAAVGISGPDVDKAKMTLTSRALGSNASFLIDEIRVGTTLADVTVVPEPAFLGLIGLTSLALLRRRQG